MIVRYEVRPLRDDILIVVYYTEEIIHPSVYLYSEKYEISRQRMHDTDIPYWGMCDHSWRRMIHGTVTHVVGGLTVNSEPPPPSLYL